MRPSTLLPVLLSCLLVVPAAAFPPAPYYRIFGTVRNERGRPLAPGEGSVILSRVHSGLGVGSVSGGGISGVSILSGGSGYASAPVVSFIGADGAGGGAAGIAILTDGSVTGVTLTSAGSGYTAPVMVGFSGGEPREVIRSVTLRGDGSNYSLAVPMDSGVSTQFFDLSAMRPFLPFTIRVVIGGTDYVPMQIAAAPSEFWKTQIDRVNSPGINTQGSNWAIGMPADKLRLDLTLGIDSDGDGLPDSWENTIINALGLGSLGDVTPEGDADGDGVSNRIEYLAGTYAFAKSSTFQLEVVEVLDAPDDGGKIAHLRFLALAGRTYKILRWTGSGEPTPVDFSLEPTGGESRRSLLADEVTEQDVYVISEDAGSQIFALSVD